jgi:hypothetical protein
VVGDKPADQERLTLIVLGLEPAPGPPAREVGALELLGHHPLKALLAGRGQQGGAGPGERRHRLPGRPGHLQVLQQPSPLGVGQPGEQPAVQPQQVEDQVGDGGPAAPAAPAGHPLLEGAEAGPAVVAEGHHLAVEHPGMLAEGPGQGGQLREPAGHVDPVAAAQGQLAPDQVAERPVAVPLGLERPVPLVGRQLPGRRRVHRPQPRRRRQRAGLGPRSPPNTHTWVIGAPRSPPEQPARGPSCSPGTLVGVRAPCTHRARWSPFPRAGALRRSGSRLSPPVEERRRVGGAVPPFVHSPRGEGKLRRSPPRGPVSRRRRSPRRPGCRGWRPG